MSEANPAETPFDRAPVCAPVCASLREIFPQIPSTVLKDFTLFMDAPLATLVGRAMRILEKPYGRNHILATIDGFGLSCAVFKEGQQTSFHYHSRRAEFYYVRRGELELHRPEGITILRAGGNSHSLPGQRHRLRNPGPSILEVLEVFTPPLLEDKVRLEDSYQRPLGEVGLYE